MSAAPDRVVLLSGLDDDSEEAALKFRLTYEGELRPTQQNRPLNFADKLAKPKHTLRRHFHRQLKHLWNTNKFLKEHRVFPQDYDLKRSISAEATSDDKMWSPDASGLVPLVDAVAEKYHEFGYRFVPLVRERASLLCSLDILFLRREVPGRVIQAGDIDNRIKTLIDSLQRPRSADDLIGDDAKPRADEDPFFCLLEDDSQISRLVVEADTLLDPLTDEDADQRKVRIVVTVEIRPYYVTTFNLSFA